MSTLTSLPSARADAQTTSAANTASARWALVSLALCTLLSSLATSIANVGLPALTVAFDASFQQAQWVVLAYLLAVTTLIVSVGRLGDIVGRRRLLLVGIIVFTASSVLCGLAPALWLLIASRAAQGLGAAVMLALAMASVGETVSKERTGSAMGMLGTMSAIGTALGPSVGGILIAAFGWRSMFLAIVPLALVTFILAQRYLPADRRKQDATRPRFDNVGTLLLASTLAAYALAMTIGRGQFGPLNIVLLSAAILGAGVFVLAEARAESPLIRLTMFRGSALAPSLVMSILVATVVMTTFVVGPFYLARGLGLNEALVGMVMAVGPIISIATGIPSGRIVDRLGAPSMVVIGLALMTVGSLTLAAMPASFGAVGYLVGIAVLSPGYQLFQAANNTVVMADVRADQRGLTSGILNLSRNLGLITGASVMGAVFATASAARDITTASAEAVAHGMHVTFAVAGGLIAIALVMAIASRARARR